MKPESYSARETHCTEELTEQKDGLSTGTLGYIEQAGAHKRSPVCHNEMQTAVQEIINNAIASGHQTAVQCCVYINGQLVVDAWGGNINKTGGHNIDGHSLFPVFSTGKALFVTAVHRAVELGKLSYDMKIAQIWPEFACNGKEVITLRDVLSHRSGLPTGPLPGTSPEDELDWDFMVTQCAAMQPAFPPGTRTQYLSKSYAWLLGEPLARAVGKKLPGAIRELVLQPAGIVNDFYFGIDDSVSSRCVTVYDGVEKYNFTKMNQAMRGAIHERCYMRGAT